jgi:hypothetical protein
MSLDTLVNAATLKGYLLATKAPKYIIALAEGIVDGEVRDARPENPGIEEYRPLHFTPPLDFTPLPEDETPLSPSLPPAELPNEPDALGEDAAPTPIEKPSIPAPEMAQGEEKAVISAGEDRQGGYTPRTRGEYCWKPEQKEALMQLKVAGTGWEEIAAAVGRKVRQCQSMWHLERRKIAAEGAGILPKRPAGGDVWNPKLTASDLPAILEELETMSFEKCGLLHNVTGHAIIDFLKRSGINHTHFKKKPGHGVKSPVTADDDGWPEPEKHHKPAREEAPAKQGDAPKMKFTIVQGKNTWGRPCEIEVVEPLSVGKDPETGAKITKYPPGYAMGTYPQKNVSVKGGS